MAIIGPVTPEPATPVVPTLSKTTFLTDPSDSIAYIIRHFCSAPKSVTETTWSSNISIEDIISRYSGSIDTICSQAQQALATVFNRIYGNGSTTVTVTYQTTNQIDYAIVISVLVGYNNNIYSISSNITVNSNGQLILS